MTKFYPNLKGKGGTIDLCPTCHDKVHYILEPIHLALYIVAGTWARIDRGLNLIDNMIAAMKGCPP